LCLEVLFLVEVSSKVHKVFQIRRFNTSESFCKQKNTDLERNQTKPKENAKRKLKQF